MSEPECRCPCCQLYGPLPEPPLPPPTEAEKLAFREAILRAWLKVRPPLERDLRECVGLLKRCAFYVRGDDPVFGAEIDALLSRLQAPTPKDEP